MLTAQVIPVLDKWSIVESFPDEHFQINMAGRRKKSKKEGRRTIALAFEV